MPHAQQIKRATSIVFLSNCGRLMPLDLSDNADRDFTPLGQRPERAPQAMQRNVR